MRILFLANRFPYPPFRGDKLKIYHLAKRLADRHEVFLLTFAEEESDFDLVPKLAPVFSGIKVLRIPKFHSYLQCVKAVFTNTPFQIAYFGKREMHVELNRCIVGWGIEVVHTQHLRMSQYTRELDLPRILDLPDAYSLYWKRRMKSPRPWWQQIFDAVEGRRVQRYERETLKFFDLNLVCSVEDEAHLKREYPGIPTAVLKNGVDLDIFSEKQGVEKEPYRIIFTGNMTYAPNVDSVTWFVRELFPRIVAEIPEARLYIVGQKPGPKVLELRSDRIEVTGFVKDLATEYQKSVLATAPLRFGAGTQNKVIEAMTMGIPVVSMYIGFEGLEITPGQGVFPSKDGDEFVAHCVRLLKNAEQAKRVGKAGQRTAVEKYSWNSISQQLEGYLQRVLNGRGNP